MIRKTCPSTSIWVPFLNWLVEITAREGSDWRPVPPSPRHGGVPSPTVAPAPRPTDPLTLPCGRRLTNRLGRAAMTEALVGPRATTRPPATSASTRPTPAAARPRADRERDGRPPPPRAGPQRRRRRRHRLAALRRWAESAAGAPTLVQIATPAARSTATSSAAGLPVRRAGRGLAGAFAPPRALTRRRDRRDPRPVRRQRRPGRRRGLPRGPDPRRARLPDQQRSSTRTGTDATMPTAATSAAVPACCSRSSADLR